MRTSRIYQFTNAEFIRMFKESTSCTEFLIRLGLGSKGSNSSTVKVRCKELKSDWGELVAKGKYSAVLKSRNRRFNQQVLSDEKLFRADSPHKRSVARRRILKNNLIPVVCRDCGITDTWNGKPINLHLEHINGIPNDHRLENLCWLCPNCHSQTDTYAGRSKKHKVKMTKKEIIKKAEGMIVERHAVAGGSLDQVLSTGPGLLHPKQRSFCSTCKKEISVNSTYCREHLLRPTKIEWPSDEELKRLVWEKPLIKLGEDLGVSDNAIRKRCKRLGIELPHRGHWIRIARTGTTASEATRKKISEASKGNIPTNRKAVKATKPDASVLFWESTEAAGRALGINPVSISRWCSGQRKQPGAERKAHPRVAHVSGWVFEFVA